MSQPLVPREKLSTFLVLKMTSTTYQKEMRSLQRKLKRSLSIPLTDSVLMVGLALWWTNGKDIATAKMWLREQYTQCKLKSDMPLEQKKCLKQKVARVNHLEPLPEEWSVAVDLAIDRWSASDDAAILCEAGHWKSHLKKARRFLLDKNIVAYVEKANKMGVTVSTRAVIDKAKLKTGVDVSRVRALCTSTSNKERCWVNRWAKRVKLTRGRFAAGEDMSDEKKISKASWC